MRPSLTVCGAILPQPQVAEAARFFGAIYFKNTIQRQWAPEEGESPIAEQDRAVIRKNIVAFLFV